MFQQVLKVVLVVKEYTNQLADTYVRIILKSLGVCYIGLFQQS